MEDHYPEGGLGDAVLASLAMVRNTLVKKLAVNNVPRSGTNISSKILHKLNSFMSIFETKISDFPGPPAELLEMFGISASSVVAACNEIIKQ